MYVRFRSSFVADWSRARPTRANLLETASSTRARAISAATAGTRSAESLACLAEVGTNIVGLYSVHILRICHLAIVKFLKIYEFNHFLIR